MIKNDAGSIKNLGRDQDAAMSEAEWTREVIAYAKQQGWMVAHFRPAQVRSGRFITAMSGDVGYPDLTMARDEVVLFVELKVGRNKPTDAQLRWASELPDYMVWYPKDRDSAWRLLA